MPRQNKQDYSSVGLKKSTIKQLKDYKIHPNQSMEEVIKQFLDEKNKLKKEVSEKWTYKKYWTG